MQDCFYPFTDHATPIWLRRGVVATQVDEQWRARKERNWQTLQASRAITENATLLHVSHAADSTVTVEPSITYRDIVGVRACGTPHSAPYRALSALAVVITSDGYWLLFERDSGDWPHSFECPGGFVRAATPPATVDEFINTRLDKEVALLTPQTQWCAGYYALGSILEHMYVYQVTVKESAAQAIELYGSAVLALSPTEFPAYLAGSLQARLPLHAPSQTILTALLATAKEERQAVPAPLVASV